MSLCAVQQICFSHMRQEPSQGESGGCCGPLYSRLTAADAGSTQDEGVAVLGYVEVSSHCALLLMQPYAANSASRSDLS